MMNNGLFIGLKKQRQSGIALLEALLSLGLVTGGVIASLAFNANVVSVSTSTRVSSAALAGAQAKLEELRNVDFADIVSGNDDIQFASPGFIGQTNITIRRCWITEQINDPAGTTVDGIRRLTVAAVGGGANCDASDGGSPVRLSALIAESDPRLAASNVANFAGADGAASKVNALPASATGLTPTTNSGGFQIYRDASDPNKILAISSPGGGPVLVPNGESSLKYATISGNIIFRGARTITEAKAASVVAEGNAICRTYWPEIATGQTTNNTTIPPTITTVTPPPSVARTSGGLTETITYIQYSCIVADGWRRSIYLLTRNANRNPKDKVCVGFPSQQGTSSVDVLLSPGRQYFGRSGLIDAPTLAGIRGAFDDSAQIGSVCLPGQPCYQDSSEFSARGWVPGGHHFTVVDQALPEQTEQFCATQIEQMFRVIDQSNPADDTTQDTVYRNYLFRNPQKVACINNKTYNDLLEAEDPIDLNSPSSDCYTTTKVGGFLTPLDASDINPFDIRFGANAPLLIPCLPAGAFGRTGTVSHGGGYVCGFPDLPGSPTAIDKSLFVNINARGFQFGYGASAGTFVSQSTFTANGVATFQGGATAVPLPSVQPHDYTNISFSFIGTDGFCPTTVRNWSVAGSEAICSASVTGAANGTNVPVNATSPQTGSATFQCVNSEFSLTPAPGATCSGPVTPPPASDVCSAVAVGGSKANNRRIDIVVGSGTAQTCTEVTKDSYSCSVANGVLGDSIEIRQYQNANSFTAKFDTIQKVNGTIKCGYTINF
jgi:Tfp pilus assembly protein PilV